MSASAHLSKSHTFIRNEVFAELREGLDRCVAALRLKGFFSKDGFPPSTDEGGSCPISTHLVHQRVVHFRDQATGADFQLEVRLVTKENIALREINHWAVISVNQKLANGGIKQICQKLLMSSPPSSEADYPPLVLEDMRKAIKTGTDTSSVYNLACEVEKLLAP